MGLSSGVISQLEDAEKVLTNANVPNNAPEWVASLITTFKGLITELKSLNEKVGKVVEMEALLAVQRNTTDLLQGENKKLNQRIDLLEIIVDNNEQHDRNINLLLHGVPEVIKENSTTQFVNALKDRINITENDISRSHRLGPPRKDGKGPRPIIVRFREETKKIQVYGAKKSLKGKRLLLTENLTKRRQTLFKTAMTILGNRQVWTNEGRLFTKVNNRLIEIRSESDIPEVGE